jgi:long-chain fatty acid transport protein
MTKLPCFLLTLVRAFTKFSMGADETCRVAPERGLTKPKMKTKIGAAVAWLALAVLHLGSAVPLHAGGYIIPHQTARGLALSNAVTAGVNDPSAVYYNPAALSEVAGDNLLASGTYVNLINSVENSGQTATDQHDDHFLASLFANYHIPGTDLTLGIGTYSPFGLGTDYTEDFTRFAAQRSELKTIYVTPALSWKPFEFMSLGAGMSFVHASSLFTRGLCLDPFTGCATPGGLEGRLRLTDTANAFAYNLGFLFKPTASIKLGFTYRSRADLRFDSADVKFSGGFSPSTTKGKVRPFPLPPVIDAGVFWQISPAWGAEFVYEYTHWSEFKKLAANFSPPVTYLPLGASLSSFSLPEDWRNTSTLRLGSFYAVTPALEVRGGIAVEESPIPNHTLNPAIPDAPKLTLNGGVGYKFNKVSLDLGYMAVFYQTRRVTNNELEGSTATGIPFVPVCANGTQPCSNRDRYQTFAHFVTFSVGYHF